MNYGGNDNADSSGVLRYVIVKHTGLEVAPGDELNCITFKRWSSTTVPTATAASGNVTLSESEITIGNAALNLTNNVRDMSQHSPWVVNLQLGFDAPNERHNASLAYNAFGERLFFAGVNGAPDAFEQPFHSLDLIYSYYPTEAMAVKLRLENLLDEQL